MASINVSRRAFCALLLASVVYVTPTENTRVYETGSRTPNEDVKDSRIGIAVKHQDVLDIKRLVQTEVVHSLRIGPFRKQLRGVVDTVLNRYASRVWGSTLRATINAPWQFSMINSTLKGAWGRVENMPASKVSKRVSREVDAWLSLRDQGAGSTVADHLHYLNIYYSSKKSMRAWGHAVQVAAEREGLVFGAGRAKHWHNTDPRMANKRPGPLQIVLEK